MGDSSASFSYPCPNPIPQSLPPIPVSQPGLLSSSVCLPHVCPVSPVPSPLKSDIMHTRVMVFHSTRTVCNKQQTQKQLKQLLASFALFLLGVSFLSRVQELD